MTPGRTLAAMTMIDEMAARAEAAKFMVLILVLKLGEVSGW